MKKRRFIAGVLVLSMLLMGTGYAYWTKKLDITTTATTGKLDVKFTDLSIYGKYSDENGWRIINGVGQNGLANFSKNIAPGATVVTEDADSASTSITQSFTKTTSDAALVSPTPLGPNATPYQGTLSADSIKINLTDMYPGYAEVFRSDVVNDGTLAAKLSQITTEYGEISDGNNGKTANMLGVALYVQREYSSTSGNKDDASVVNVYTSLANVPGIDNHDFFTVGSVKFLRLSSLAKLNKDLSKTVENNLLYITPDANRMDVFFAVAMDPDADGSYTTGSVKNLLTKGSNNKDIDTQTKNATVKVKFYWDQFNEGKTPIFVGPKDENEIGDAQ
jgi:hypothetical protein